MQVHLAAMQLTTGAISTAVAVLAGYVVSASSRVCMQASGLQASGLLGIGQLLPP
jgi:hypothetical protein